MFAPELTISSGIEALGPVHQWVRLEVDDHNELRAMKRAYDSVCGELVSAGHASSTVMGIMLEDSAYTQQDKARIRLGCSINRRIDRYIQTEVALVDRHLKEALLNAIEHQDGAVEMRALRGQRGELWVVDQQGAGPKLEEVINQDDECFDYNYKDENGVIRGSGSNRFAYGSSLCKIWYENLENGGWRLIVLGVRAAVWSSVSERSHRD